MIDIEFNSVLLPAVMINNEERSGLLPACQATWETRQVSVGCLYLVCRNRQAMEIYKSRLGRFDARTLREAE